MTTESFYFYLQNRLIQASQTGDQWYSDTSPFNISFYLSEVETKISFIKLNPDVNVLKFFTLTGLFT